MVARHCQGGLLMEVSAVAARTKSEFNSLFKKRCRERGTNGVRETYTEYTYKEYSCIRIKSTRNGVRTRFAYRRRFVQSNPDMTY